MEYRLDYVTRCAVLIACGDQAFGHSLVACLRAEGIAARLVTHGARVMPLVCLGGVDLVIASDTVADIEPLDLCRNVHHAGVPVVLVSSRPAGVDPVTALAVGADDVIRTVRPRELVARVRAVARRYERPPADQHRRLLTAGGVELDLDGRSAAVLGNTVHLTSKEFGVLSELVANAGRVLTRRHLIQAAWGPDFAGDGKTLDVHIRRLRAKVEEDPTRPHRILTVRGVGFRYADPSQLAAAG